MKTLKGLKSWLIALAGVLVVLGSTGCIHTEDNMSERPWNSQKSWETGMPTGMMQGR